MDYCLLRAMLSLSQASPKAQVKARSVAGDLGQPGTGTDQQGC